jgi:GGDEF domain-containing protein
MNRGQKKGHDKPESAASGENTDGNAGRCLTLLAEGAAMNMPEFDAETYKEFRASVSKLAFNLPDRLPEDDKLAIVQEIIHEFERYRRTLDDEFQERRVGWRDLMSMVLRYLFGLMNIDPNSAEAAPLVKRAGSLLTGAETQTFRILLTDFLRVGATNNPRARISPPEAADGTAANHNAAGLRGKDSAVEHMGKIIDKGLQGYVVFFRLGCMNLIGERFGEEAVQDSLMTVAAFLTSQLRSDDAIFHWSDSSLVAILQSPASQQVMTSAVQRIINSNRDITIRTGDHAVMVRVPLTFEMTPVNWLRAGDDLYKLLPQEAKAW